VVSFDCDSGPREIVRPDVDGVLVAAEDTAALAQAIERLMVDPATRQRLGTRAGDVVERFSLEVFQQRWMEVLDACLS
jgi:glycosyltransferase involved in cell wall biosynthesis